MNPLPELKTDLYGVGLRYAARRAALTTAQKKTATWKAVADEFGTAPEHVRHAARFAAAVELIAANCGPDAKAVLLEEPPRLPAKVVMQIANTHADRQRYALAQVRIGRDPFGNPSADAHLVRFDAVPSIAAFRRRVARAMPGHAPIHEVVVKNWCGRGWPE